MAITFPNVVKAVGSNVSSVATSGVATTTGSTFLIACSRGPGITATPSDSKGNTYTQIAALNNNSALTVWRCENGTGGAGHTATVTLGAADYPVLFFIECAGAATSSWDATSLATNNDSLTITSGTLAQADSAVLSFIASNAGGAQNYAATGYTVARETDGDNYYTSAVGYKTVASTTAQSITWTGVGGTTPLLIFALKAAASSGTTVTPANAALAIAGQAPTVARTANQSVSPSQATVALAGQAPTIARTANQSIAPAQGALALAGQAPSVVQTSGQTVTPAQAALALSGPAPAITQTASQGVSPAQAALNIAGPVPSIDRTANQAVSPGQAPLTLAGLVPIITQATNTQVSPAQAGIALQGFAPTLAQTANQAVAPGVGALQLLGYAPSIANSGTPPAPSGLPGLDYEAAPAQSKPRRAKFVSVKPVLQAALESRLPEPETEELDQPPAANVLSAGIQALQNEQLTPAKVELLVNQWRPSVAPAPIQPRQDAQLQHLHAVRAQEQAQEVKAAQLEEIRRRAKARANDEEAIAQAVALLF